MEEGFKLELSSVCSTWAKNTRSCFERFPFAHICCCCSARQVSYHYLFFPGLESVIHPFPDSALQRWGAGTHSFHVGLSATPPLGTPEGRTRRHVLFEECPSLPNQGRILAPLSQGGQDLGRTAGPGNPTPVMSWQIQTAQAAPKVRHGKQTLAHEKDASESRLCSQACLPLLFSSPALRDERWQRLQLVVRGHLSAGINKLNNAA